MQNGLRSRDQPARRGKKLIKKKDDLSICTNREKCNTVKPICKTEQDNMRLVGLSRTNSRCS